MIRNDEYQLEIAEQIAKAFEDGAENVVLEAPTGSGKSRYSLIYTSNNELWCCCFITSKSITRSI